MARQARSEPRSRMRATGTLVAAAAALVLGAPAPAAAATFAFQSSFFQFGATGPASGTLETAAGTGGPGDVLTLADIVSFQFSHTFAPGTTIVFTTADLVSISGTLTVAPDGSGLESGGWIAVNGDDARMRAVNNVGDVNDNYLVDSTSTASNGAFGGAFGGWVLVPEPGSAVLLASGLACMGLRRRRRA